VKSMMPWAIGRSVIISLIGAPFKHVDDDDDDDDDAGFMLLLR